MRGPTSIASFASRVRQSQFGMATLRLSTGTALGQAVAALSAPLLSRLYTPVDYGQFAIFVAAFTWLLPVSGGRLEMAINRSKTDDEATSATLASIGITVLLTAVLALVVPLAAAVVGISVAPTFLLMLTASILLASIARSLGQWHLRQRDFKRVARSKFSQGTGQNFAQAGFALLAGSSSIGLQAGHVFGHLSSAACFFGSVPRGALSLRQLKPIAAVIKANRELISFSTISVLFNAGAFAVLPPLLSATYGVATAGQVSMANRVIAMPMGLMALTVAQVFYAEAARRAHDRVQLAALHRSTMRKLLVIGVPLITTFAFAAPLVFPYILGEAWNTAGRFAALLAPFYVAQFVASPLSQTLLLLNQERLQLLFDVLRMAGSVGILIAGRWMGWEASVTLFAWGVIMTSAYTANLAACSRLLRES